MVLSRISKVTWPPAYFTSWALARKSRPERLVSRPAAARESRAAVSSESTSPGAAVLTSAGGTRPMERARESISARTSESSRAAAARSPRRGQGVRHEGVGAHPGQQVGQPPRTAQHLPHGRHAREAVGAAHVPLHVHLAHALVPEVDDDGVARHVVGGHLVPQVQGRVAAGGVAHHHGAPDLVVVELHGDGVARQHVQLRQALVDTRQAVGGRVLHARVADQDHPVQAPRPVEELDPVAVHGALAAHAHPGRAGQHHALAAVGHRGVGGGAGVPLADAHRVGHHHPVLGAEEAHQAGGGGQRAARLLAAGEHGIRCRRGHVVRRHEHGVVAGDQVLRPRLHDRTWPKASPMPVTRSRSTVSARTV